MQISLDMLEIQTLFCLTWKEFSMQLNVYSETSHYSSQSVNVLSVSVLSGLMTFEIDF